MKGLLLITTLTVKAINTKIFARIDVNEIELVLSLPKIIDIANSKAYLIVDINSKTSGRGKYGSGLNKNLSLGTVTLAP